MGAKGIENPAYGNDSGKRYTAFSNSHQGDSSFNLPIHFRTSSTDVSEKFAESQVNLTSKHRDDDNYDPYEHRNVAHPLS